MGSSVILCVDSDASSLDHLKKALSARFGQTHEIAAFARGREALDFFADAFDKGVGFPVVLCELELDDMTGADLLETVDMRSRNVNKILTVSDAPVTAVARVLGKVALFRLITKPWESDDLAFTVYQAIESYENHASIRKLMRENEALVGRVTKTLHETIDALSSAIESRDPLVVGHTRRVTELSLRLGEEVMMPAWELTRLEMACRLYDVGKIAVPDRVLLSEGRYTANQFELMRRHVLIGADIISRISGLEDLQVIIRHHHERYDGTGYPDGLKGGAIPLGARIIALADAYDAMVSDRNFRSRLTREQAYAELERNSGGQFDPALTDRFIGIVKSVG